MSRVLIVLTDKYPYGEGETFIEAEREYWKCFDKVIISPVLVRKGDTIRNGFFCDRNECLIETAEERITIFSILRGLTGGISCNETLREWRLTKNMTNKKMLFAMTILTNLRIKRIARQISKLIGTDGNTRILIYSYWMYEPALVSIGLKRRFIGSGLITRAHGYDLYEERQENNYVPYRQLVLRTMNRIYPISENGRLYLHEQYNGKYDEKIKVERLGTIRLFSLNDGKQNTSSVTIVSCSNLVPLKRVDRIIDALNEFDREVEWVHFGDGELMESLKYQAEKLPSRIHVHFMGRLPNEDVQRFYSTHKIDVFVNVSETEGIPVSIMEAQSYGIPVIATDVGGTSELVINEKNGVLLNKAFSNEELLCAFENVITNQEKYCTEALKTWENISDAHRLYGEFFKRELDTLMSD